MELITNNLEVFGAILGTIVTVFAGWQINKRQAATAAKEGDAQVEKIKNDIEISLWQRAKEELGEKDKEIADLKAANNHLAQEDAKKARKIRELESRIKRLEERLDTGELTPPPHDIPLNE